MPTNRVKMRGVPNGDSDSLLANVLFDSETEEFLDVDGPGSVLSELYQEGIRLHHEEQEATDGIAHNFIQGLAFSQDKLLDNLDEFESEDSDSDSVGDYLLWK